MGTQSALLMRAPAREAKEGAAARRASAPPRAGAVDRALTLLARTAAPQSVAQITAFAAIERKAITPSAEPRIPLQRKLAIGAVDDPLEHEADRVAAQVMRTSARETAQTPHTKCVGSPERAVNSSPPGIGRFPASSNEPPNAAAVSVEKVLAGAGSPLEPTLRHDVEQRFGHDFSRVRIHSGAAAEQSAQEMNANAYTLGQHIVFGAGRFAPATQEGRRLLAHELAHVVQRSAALQRQPATSTASTALYPTADERQHIQEILNPQATKAPQGVPPVTDPDGFKAAMQARMKPYIDAVVADANERKSSSVSLSLGTIQSLADVAQPAVESFYGSYLRTAVHTQEETTRRAGFHLREHVHLVPTTLQPYTDDIARAWVLSRMERRGADLLQQFHVLSGAHARDQALFEDVGKAIFEDRKDDLRTIVLFYPGFHAGGEVSIQGKLAPFGAEPVIDTERRGRWQTLDTTIHEMLHDVTHERFVEAVQPLERSRIAVEGFTEYFTRPVYESLANRAMNDSALRTAIEGVALPYKGELVPPSEAGGYKEEVEAVREIVRILGGSDEGLKLAYFQGLLEYIGLGGWNEEEAARRRFPGNTLGFGALLTYDNSGLLHLDYARVVMGRAGALQLRLGGRVDYLTQGQRLGLGGTLSLRYQGTNAYIEGGVGVGASAAVAGAPLSNTVSLDLIPGMELGVRLGAFRVGANALLLTPIKGGPVSDKVVRLGLGIGVGLDF
jgi:hypothetical protein